VIEPVTLPGGVVLRPLTEHDAPALTEAYVRNREHLRPWEPRRPESFYTLTIQAQMLEAMLAKQAAGQATAWVLADGDLIVGRMTLNDTVRGPFLSTNLGYWIDAGHTGRGLATAAVREVCRMADEELRLHRVAAGTLVHNVASQNVLRKAGFELYGTAPRYLEIDGRWQDHRLFQLILNDRPAF
jgi:ribosomal-protein-alanine N-acetyltransferase